MPPQSRRNPMTYGRALFALVFVFQVASATAAPTRDALRDASAVTCSPNGHESISLRSTDRLPEASGTSRVERMGGTTKVEVELESVKPASLFGGDYNTYVLWVVPPEGRPESLGEVILNGDRSKLVASTAECVFAVIVTAEPHYLVSVPSSFVVVQNNSEEHGPIVHYRVLEGVYNFNRSSLENAKEAKGTVH